MILRAVGSDNSELCLTAPHLVRKPALATRKHQVTMDRPETAN